MITDTRLGRYLLWNRPTDRDHLRFPSVPLAPAPVPLVLPEIASLPDLGPITVRRPHGVEETSLETLLPSTGTTALVVVTKGRIVLEWYGHSLARDVPGRCFSVTKSFASALVGAAIDDGLIPGINARVADLLPEFADSPIGALTLSHLLEMRSGLRFRPGPLPWSDDAICYFSPDCRKATRSAPMTDPVGAAFQYNAITRSWSA